MTRVRVEAPPGCSTHGGLAGYLRVMRVLALTLTVVILGFPLYADDAAGARQAEVAFAKAFADRDAAAFFSLVADDAKFFGKTKTLSGKAAVVEGWSAYLKDPKAPFSWRPERVETNAAGDLAFSTGPVFDAAGNHIGNYASVWQKQNDGTWKIVFDGPPAPACK